MNDSHAVRNAALLSASFPSGRWVWRVMYACPLPYFVFPSQGAESPVVLHSAPTFELLRRPSGYVLPQPGGRLLLKD